MAGEYTFSSPAITTYFKMSIFRVAVNSPAVSV